MAIEISPQQTCIGWIGTGVMGRSMCGHLLNAGYKVTLFNRTKSKAAGLLERGARWADSPRGWLRRLTSSSRSSVFQTTCDLCSWRATARWRAAKLEM
jgi:3-hydroxyacyl-CoA dehydrogenase